MNKAYTCADIVLYLNSIAQAIHDKRKQTVGKKNNRRRSGSGTTGTGGSGDTTFASDSFDVDSSEYVVPSAIKTNGAQSGGRSCEDELLEKEYNDLLYSEKFATYSSKLLELRKLILLKGLPDFSSSIDSESSDLDPKLLSRSISETSSGTFPSTDNLIESSAHKNSLRTSIWKLLLGVSFEFKPEEYRQKLMDGPTPLDSKIRDDSFRTFKNSEEFWSKVENDDLIRVLNAIAHEHGYVQGMNVLLAPFIFTMHEIDSYYCFKALITNHCPQYISMNLDGVTAACSLFRQSLQALDPQLFTHIRKWMPDLEAWRSFSMPPLMTLFASMKPLGEVLKVWDAIFAFGIHFNIILLVVHVMLIRDSLLQMNNAYKIKTRIEKSNKALDAELLVHCALGMVQFLDQDLFKNLAMHPIVLLAHPREETDRDHYPFTHPTHASSLRRHKTAPAVSTASLHKDPFVPIAHSSSDLNSKSGKANLEREEVKMNQYGDMMNSGLNNMHEDRPTVYESCRPAKADPFVPGR